MWGFGKRLPFTRCQTFPRDDTTESGLEHRDNWIKLNVLTTANRDADVRTQLSAAYSLSLPLKSSPWGRGGGGCSELVATGVPCSEADWLNTGGELLWTRYWRRTSFDLITKQANSAPSANSETVLQPPSDYLLTIQSISSEAALPL